jgi:hypothetical protein
MMEILLLVHKILLIVTVGVLGALFLVYGTRMLLALASSARDSFKAEPYYSGFLVLIATVSTLSLFFEVVK